MRAGFLCVFVLGVASGPRVGLAGCKSALGPPVVCSADRSGAVVPVLVLLFVALWFILRGDLLCVVLCVILFLCFSVLLVLRLPRLGAGGWSWCCSCVCSVCACLDLSVSSSSWGLGRAAVCDCDTPWTFLLPFFENIANKSEKNTRSKPCLQHVHLLHDHAPAYKSSTVAQIFKPVKVNVLSYPPYSTDLGTCEFSSFPKLKMTIW